MRIVFVFIFASALLSSNCSYFKTENSAREQVNNGNTIVERDTVPFIFEDYIKDSIKRKKPIESLFNIRYGMGSFDSSFILEQPEFYKLLNKKILLPLDSVSEVVAFSLNLMSKRSYNNMYGRMKTGICCLGVFAMYDFEFNNDRYIALYASEYSDDYNPDLGIFDPILLLYKVYDDDRVKLLISCTQSDSELKALGDIDNNGKLDFIRNNHAYPGNYIFSFELDTVKEEFVNTGRFLFCFHENEGNYVIKSKSKWYK